MPPQRAARYGARQDAVRRQRRAGDAETDASARTGQEDGVSETSVVTEFRWIEAGDGLPVLCLHGLFGASEHWEPTGRGHRAPLPSDGADPAHLRDSAGRSLGDGPPGPRRGVHGRRASAPGDRGRQLAGRPRRARPRAPRAGARAGARALRVVGSLRAELHPGRAAPPDDGIRAREDDRRSSTIRPWSRPSGWRRSVAA